MEHKKQAGEFMYEEFATYWEDVLKHISFVPDYLSIQNESTWVTDWETCEWRPAETADFPSYEIALDMVAEKLKTLFKEGIEAYITHIILVTDAQFIAKQ